MAEQIMQKHNKILDTYYTFMKYANTTMIRKQKYALFYKRKMYFVTYKTFFDSLFKIFARKIVLSGTSLHIILPPFFCIRNPTLPTYKYLTATF